MNILSSPQSDSKNLSLNEDEETKSFREEFIRFFSGSLILPNSRPASHCYVGHQFGVFAGQLGDGRAISVGDFFNSAGNLYEIQLKGSGRTPFSRSADGRAVLRSSIREFLASEHLFSLGIPTTRALSIIGSNSKVVRDLLYNGNAKLEKCAVVTRVAPSFLRFGSFEIFKKDDALTGDSGPSPGMEEEMLPKMLEYVIDFHYKEVKEDNKIKEPIEGDKNEKSYKNYEKLFGLVCERTALLAAYWQAYGFTHGVLNTDNMSLLGLTIDYGPYGFLEFFDKSYTPNHSDEYGRYRYSQQPEICKWNLNKLAEAFNFCLDKETGFKLVEDIYDSKFREFYYKINSNKLGMFLSSEINYEDTKQYIDETFSLLQDYGIDLTMFFRSLSEINKIFSREINSSKFSDIEELRAHLASNEKVNSICKELIEKNQAYSLPFNLRKQNNKLLFPLNLLEKWEIVLNEDEEILYSFGINPETIKLQLKKRKENEEFNKKFPTKDVYEKKRTEDLVEFYNKYINKVLQEYTLFLKNLDDFKVKKFSKNEVKNDFIANSTLSRDCYRDLIKETRINYFENLKNLAEKINRDEAINLGNLQEFLSGRFNAMNSINPKFILRNYIAQEVIEQSEKGNFYAVNRLLNILISPFDEHEDLDFEKDYSPNIEKALNICISCSS